MEGKGLIASTDSIDSDSIKMAENNVSDHEISSALLTEKATTQSFSWSLRKLVTLASLCLVMFLSFGAFSMISPFYPHEVSSIASA